MLEGTIPPALRMRMRLTSTAIEVASSSYDATDRVPRPPPVPSALLMALFWSRK